MADHTVGSNTELAAAIEWMRSDRRRQLVSLVSGPDGDETERAVATIVCAVLARPAAGRDLTAQDVHDAVVAWNVAPGEPDRDQFLADRLNAVARPSVARTDGQPPAPLNGLTVEDVLDIVAPYLTGEASTCECPDSFRDNSVPVPYCLRHTVGPRVEAEVEQALRAAAPADDTAAPDPTQLDELAASWTGRADLLDQTTRLTTDKHDVGGARRAAIERSDAYRQVARELREVLPAARPVRDGGEPT